jgi:hypothetical protein
VCLGTITGFVGIELRKPSRSSIYGNGHPIQDFKEGLIEHEEEKSFTKQDF